MKRVRVSAGRGPYDVLIGRNILTQPALQRTLGTKATGIVISSDNVMKLHGKALFQALGRTGLGTHDVLVLRDGEGAKSLTEWAKAVRMMAQAGLDRSSFVVAFGGGSIGDAAGFAAATYMRGIRLVQIPTTLLSMVDSSVGGKTGINLTQGKNLVGSFHQPDLVLADLGLLDTLPARERQSGVYEILKCGLLRSMALVKLVERTRGLRQASDRDLETAIAEAVRVKARIVERDERESGERVLLNLGHTLGHALEAATSYRLLTHGEAVGYGMEFAVDLGEKLGITETTSARHMRAAIRGVGRRTPLPSVVVGRTLNATLSDKKREGSELKEVLLAAAQRPLVHRMEARAFAEEAGHWLADRVVRRPGTRRASVRHQQH